MNEFTYLDKMDFDRNSEKLFSILFNNMNPIVPSDDSYENECRHWSKVFGGAFKGRKERHIVLINASDRTLAGFFCYAVIGDTFYMEEIQIIPEYQGSGIFRRLYGFVLESLPQCVKHVEAYAHRNNAKSAEILKMLGLVNVGISENNVNYHFTGSFENLLCWYNQHLPK